MKEEVTAIIPTYRNPYWLKRCLESIAGARMPELGSVHVIDNGGDMDRAPYDSNSACANLRLVVHREKENIGWTKGLQRGLRHVGSQFVLFLNDDIEFERKPTALSYMLEHFSDPKVAMVGPATGTAMGLQAQPGPDVEDTNLLVGFCQLVRVKALKKIGGLDTQFNNGGDDIDLSIRFHDAGYRMIVDRRVFVYHHGYKTGTRLFGPSSISGGWNSRDHTVEIYGRIIKKHGRDKLLTALALAPERGGIAVEHAYLPAGKA